MPACAFRLGRLPSTIVGEGRDLACGRRAGPISPRRGSGPARPAGPCRGSNRAPARRAAPAGRPHARGPRDVTGGRVGAAGCPGPARPGPSRFLPRSPSHSQSWIGRKTLTSAPSSAPFVGRGGGWAACVGCRSRLRLRDRCPALPLLLRRPPISSALQGRFRCERVTCSPDPGD